MPLIKSNVHTHTDFCDGSNSMQDMAEYAVNIGLETLGFSFHSFTEFDKSYCIRDYYGYIKEYYRVKNLFKDRLTVLNGVELDLYGERPSVCDFVIGSAHYIKKGTRHMAVDCSEDLFRDIAARGYSGDYLFEKGKDKILKKVGEECTEVIIAAKGGDKKETVFEIADLAYHLMVLMVNDGITLKDVKDELASRHVVDKKVKQERMQ
ncbi:MAG: phosphoribosyl-ATP diphosphatase [Clostridia bacterium]|nr:phosphoribosyl-ATP diphosphatase [Clostridia bacterium]